MGLVPPQENIKQSDNLAKTLKGLYFSESHPFHTGRLPIPKFHCLFLYADSLPKYMCRHMIIVIENKFARFSQCEIVLVSELVKTNSSESRPLWCCSDKLSIV